MVVEKVLTLVVTKDKELGSTTDTLKEQIQESTKEELSVSLDKLSVPS